MVDGIRLLWVGWRGMGTLHDGTDVTRAAGAELLREHADPYAADRPPLAVDRQRVIHSAAFRRLQYKTQVFVERKSDHFRSRLTHTLEVAYLSRTIAERLRVNSELAEVVALAHDLGHPPFGHAGERALDACVQAHSGGARMFEHNEHSLRVVEQLEHPYPEFHGLNLTRAVRRCLRTHRTKFDRAADESVAVAPLESRVVAQADYLTYTFHDLADGVYAGLIAPDDLAALDLWRAGYAGPEPMTEEVCRRYLRPSIERMQRALIDDLLETFLARPHEVGEDTDLTLSDEGEALLSPLDELLTHKVYHDAGVRRADDAARRTLSALFDAYVATPALLPARFLERIGPQDALAVVTDYVAGMTDRFCQAEHARIIGGSESA